MSLAQKTVLVLGLSILALTWGGPLPRLAQQSFAAHMTMHVAVIAVAAPLLAIAIAGTVADPARRAPRFVAPMAASLLELAIVWAWHAPAWHHAARQDAWALALEQASFLIAGLVLWLSVTGGPLDERRHRAATGVAALLFTSMHMTLLGALFAMASRPLFAAHTMAASALPDIADQHLGGTIMLLVGGLSYLAGGVILTARLLRERATI